MKKFSLSLAFSCALIFTAPASSYGMMGGGQSAGAGGMQALVGGAASGAYASKKFGCCSWKRINCCIQGVLGIMQLVQMLKGANNSFDAAETLLNGSLGEFSFDPADAGMCLSATNGCSPDAIDSQLSGLQDAFKTGSGYGEAIAEMERNALEQLEQVEKMGFKVDMDKGTLTDPNGKVTSLSDSNLSLPKALSKSASSKLAGILDKSGLGSVGGKGSRGLASKAGGVIFKDEFIGANGLGGMNGKNKKNDGKDKAGEFLAGLSDKDAKNGGIGFAGDNIFGMIKRRYGKKVQAKEFLNK